MWYFAWILGVGFAASFGVIYALWFEQDERVQEQESQIKNKK